MTTVCFNNSSFLKANLLRRKPLSINHQLKSRRFYEKKRNGDLPGMGGVFNTVNFHLYHYAGNNPVKYVDPDGKLITVQGDDGVTYTWDNEKNKLYSGSDSNRDYDVKDKYALIVQADLNKIEAALNAANDEIALSDYNKLADTRDYTVRIERFEGQNGKFSSAARSIKYNPDFTNSPSLIDASGNTNFPAFVVLGHELGHAKDHFGLGHSAYIDARLSKYATDGFPNWVEQSAVEFENFIRRGYNPDPGFQRPRYLRQNK